MDALYLDRLRTALSAPRIGRYEDRCAGDRRAAIALYSWNVEVSCALWGILHHLEIASRNAMHRELAAYFSRPNWWTAPTLQLHPTGRRMVDEALRDLTRRRSSTSPDAVVAELRFGFWVSLLGKGNDYEVRLWRPALYRAFPGYVGPRAPLYVDVNSVRLLRNRIAHHEPIHARHLAADHATVRRLIRMVSAEADILADQGDRVTEVLARRPS